MKTLSFSEYQLRLNIALTNNIPVIVKSGPGEGKTQTCKQLAKERGSDCLVINAVNKNPSHVNGLPFRGKDGASFDHYDFMRTMFNAKKELIVVIDDVLLSTMSMQGSFMNLIEERAIDGKPIPDCVKFLITTNDAGQGAGSGGLLTPLINRAIILDFPRDVDQWKRWALSEGVSKEIVLFIHAFPNALYSDSYPKGITAFPSPRSWTKANPFVQAGIHDSTTLAGLVGAKYGLEASAFIDNLEKFGNVLAKVLNDPASAPVFTDLSDIYGVLLICSNSFEKKNVEKIITYFKRYKNEEMISILFAIGCSSFPDSKETKAYRAHVTVA
jgi:hypothetical protein